jgi:precorrin-6Y C5,15-methyltransferase (decarboxylating)
VHRRIKDIEINSRKFSVINNITPVRGEAPQVLKTLPKPHRIFIGGTAGQLKPVLRYCLRVLLPAGKIVINATTVETVSETLSLFKQRGWRGTASLVNIAALKTIGDKERFQPLNPVFIIEGRAPGGDSAC